MTLSVANRLAARKEDVTHLLLSGEQQLGLQLKHAKAKAKANALVACFQHKNNYDTIKMQLIWVQHQDQTAAQCKALG